MSATALSMHEGQFAILEAELPGQDAIAIGILLRDPTTDGMHIRLRRDWRSIAGEDSEVFEALKDDLESKARELGATRFVEWLDDTLSNTVRITNEEFVPVGDFERTLNRLYAQHVQSTISRETHVPRWSLRVAAGPFLDNAEVEPEGFEEAPEGVGVKEGMFAATIAGTSMEPYIPNGSVCLFRPFGAGSRQGKQVLVEDLGQASAQRYTVKRYVSEKRTATDGNWEHEKIRLEPLNPEHEAWYLDPEEERYRVLAEFVCVLY